MKYFWATIRHKWFVLLASRKMGLPLWRALIHDLSKFGPSELFHYDRQFFGDKGDPEGFAIAWLHHYHRNDHHWEYWIVESIHSHSSPDRDDGCIVNNCLEMPGVCVKEMVVDWMGASRAYTGSWDMSSWLEKSLPNLQLHPETRKKVYLCLYLLGYDQLVLYTDRKDV